MSHSDAVVRAPAGFGVTASTPTTPVAAMEDPERGLYAVQFHPEVQHTPRGTEMLDNFLTSACHAPATWTALAVIDEQVELIRAQVGDDPRDLRPVGRRRLAPWRRCSSTAPSATS